MSIRSILAIAGVILLAGCTSATNWGELHRQSGRTVADVTLVAGDPDSFSDLPDGTRAFRWERWHLVPRGGQRCIYTLFAVQEGRERSLAAWRVTGSEVPGPGCEPLERAPAANV